MSQHFLHEAQIENSDKSLSMLILKLWRYKLVIIATSFLFAVAGVIFALSKPNVYTAEALLSPVSEQSGLKIPGQLGGLAALAGVNLGGLSGGGDNTKVALEILKSRDFITKFISKHELLIPIMAAKGWDRTENVLIIDEEIYDTASAKWIREVKAPYSAEPSLLEAYKAFDELLKVSEDKLSGMVTVSVTYFSPTVAKRWVDQLVQDLNQTMRDQELREAENSIAYLNRQIETTQLAEVRTMLYSLIEEQTKTLMLANVRDEYVFKVIDPAVIEEEKSGPMRAFIVILFGLLGGFLSVALVLSLFRD